MGTKITNVTKFPKSIQEKSTPNPKSKSWNKKNKNRNMTNAKQKFNMILL